jgi:NADP-dependent 3-hydroxy acid dehydrogenase YdfG
MTGQREWSSRLAVVTGATSGIGNAVARMIVERGGRVVLSAPPSAELAERARELGPRAAALPLELADGAAVDRAAQDLPPGFDRPDILVNCAGHDAGGGKPFAEAAPSDVESVILVNLLGLMRLTRALLPGMLERGPADVVNIGSVTSRQRSRNLAAYAASKHGVRGFCQSLREDYAHTDLRVTEIVPGPVRSRFAHNRLRDDTAADAFYDTFPATLTPAEIAETILWTLEQPPHVMIAELVVVPTRERRG